MAPPRATSPPPTDPIVAPSSGVSPRLRRTAPAHPRSSSPPEARSGDALDRLLAAVAREIRFVVVPAGGWTARRALGRIVLALLAVSGSTGLLVVATLVLAKERDHIAGGIRAGIRLILSRSHSGRRVPPPTAPTRRPRRPVSRPPAGPSPPGPEVPAPRGGRPRRDLGPPGPPEPGRVPTRTARRAPRPTAHRREARSGGRGLE